MRWSFAHSPGTKYWSIDIGLGWEHFGVGLQTYMDDEYGHGRVFELTLLFLSVSLWTDWRWQTTEEAK